MVDVIRASVEVVGQEYITQRLRGRVRCREYRCESLADLVCVLQNDLIQSARAAAQNAVDKHAEEKTVEAEPASEVEVGV